LPIFAAALSLGLACRTLVAADIQRTELAVLVAAAVGVNGTLANAFGAAVQRLALRIPGASSA
jgi:hypothetical protein